MGMLRSGGLAVLAIIIFLLLLVTNGLLAVTMSLNYQVLEPELISVVTDIVVERGVKAEIAEGLPSMQEDCLNSSNFTFDQAGIVMTIPCDVVGQGEVAILDFAITDIVNDIYYKDYNCTFWACSTEESIPTHLFSEMARSYWRGKLSLVLGIVIVLIVLGFLIAEGRKNYPFLLGGLVILAALPFIKVSWFFSLFGSFELARVLGVFFSQAFSVFLIMITIGVVLILLGVAIKFVGLGSFIDKIMGGEKKRMKVEVKEEVKKEIKAGK